jgi:hypothetical protein
LADDFEAGAFEQAGQALAQEDVVIGQHHPRAARAHARDYQAQVP